MEGYLRTTLTVLTDGEARHGDQSQEEGVFEVCVQALGYYKGTDSD